MEAAGTESEHRPADPPQPPSSQPSPEASDSAAPATKLNYVKKDTKSTRFLGMPAMSWNPLKPLIQIKALVGTGMAQDQHEVELHDARAAGPEYGRVGFTLQPLDSKVSDWPSVSSSGSAQNELYKSELEAVIRRLHPTVAKIEFSTFLLRGGPGENGPASGAIHLDYYPDKQRILGYLDKAQDPKNPGFNDFGQTVPDTLRAHPDLKLGLILGLWKPRNERTPVCESPLIMCDPSTVDFESAVASQEQDFYVTTEGTRVHVLNLAANLKYAEEHKWWYFPNQTKNELTVFRHYTEGKNSFANFHCAAQLPLLEGHEGRSSVETRAFLFFKKDEESL